MKRTQMQRQEKAPGLLQITLDTGLARFQCDRMISVELAIQINQMLLHEEKAREAADSEKLKRVFNLS
jgi:hypothetical protein